MHDNHVSNASPTDSVGGAISTTGPLTITNSEFANNQAGSGGAILASSAQAMTSITGCLFHDNKTTGSFPNANGAAVLVESNAPVTITTSTLRNNNGQSGAAIYVLATGQLTIANSTLSDNSATNGAALYNKGTATLTNVTVSGNNASHGGGIDNFAVLALSRVTLSANDGTYGGGIKNEGGGTANLTNVTLSGNSASYGGGIFNSDATATLNNVTLSGNSAGAALGGGIYNSGSNTHLILQNVVVANSPTGGNCKFTTAPDSSQFNLCSDNTCNFGPGRDNVANLLLGPLADNGGPTKTHLPAAGSAVIDFGTATNAPPRDQRGYLRVGATDVGAVEVGALPLPGADFNGDGFTDYLLFSSSNRRTVIWNLQGLAFLSGVNGPSLPAGLDGGLRSRYRSERPTGLHPL